MSAGGGSVTNTRDRRFRAVLLAFLLLTLGLVGTAAAFGATAGSDSPGSLGPTPQQTKEFLESGQAGALLEEPEANLHAAQTMPHRNLERGEALELAEAVFEPEIEAAGGIYDEFEPEKFLSDYAAVVPASSLPEGPSQQSESLGAEHPNMPVLVESMLPLRTETASGAEERVDLGLEHVEGGLQPENPLSEVGIPEQLGEGLSLDGPGVEITIAGAPSDRVATDANGEFAFFPDVSEDSDLIVTPTPRGIETMVDIRSADAPMQTTYDLTLPAGAELQASKEGGAEVVEGGQTTLFIPPPTAVDAAGNPVQTQLEVADESITVVTHPDASTAFPILVDPEYITEGWRWTLNHDSMAAWSPSTTNGSAMDPWPYERWNPTWYPGLDLTSGVGGWAYWGNNTNWEYWVPRYREDWSHFGNAPTTWIYQMFTEGVLFLPWGNTENYPALVLGLIDASVGWQTAEVHYGGQGEMNNWSNWFQFTNENPSNGAHDTNDKGADMNLVTYAEERPAKLRDTYMADAYVSVVDEDAPKIERLTPPEHWMNASPEPIGFAFEDTGLGIRRATVSFQGSANGSGFILNCNGSALAPCPRRVKSTTPEPGEVQASLAYNPATLPTGKDVLTVADGDPLADDDLIQPAHSFSRNVIVKVDHAAPELSLSGSLTEQGSLGTHRPSYALRVNAKDGAEGVPQSGIAKVEIRVDGKKIVMPDEADWTPNCQTENCPFANEWGLNVGEFSAGAHKVEVIATDAVGNSTVRELLIELHPPVPSLSVSGTITEQATLGVSRPQYKLKLNASSLTESPLPASPPTISAAFGTPGAGNGQFNHPADVAIDPSGNLWVVDSTNNRLEEFAPSGSWLRTVGAAGTGNGKFSRPTAIAIDSNNHIWVTDSGNKRIEEFSLTGEYLGKFGTAGTGDGQFAGSGPEGVAIDYHGNIWISDTYGGRLEEFSESGVFKHSVGTRGLGIGQLLEPTGIDVGPGGNVWVTDWGKNKVLEFTGAGQLLREFGTEGSGNGEFRHPDGIAIDSKGDVWVGDQNNERVQEFNQGGEYIGKFGSSGSGSGQFNLGYPIGIAGDAAGDIWVTDTGNNRVQKWVVPGYTTPPGPAFLRSIGTGGTGNGQFNWPTGVAVDPAGNVWVTDLLNNRLQKFTATGTYLSQFGSGGTGNGQFNHPLSTAIDSKGRLWVLDRENNRVQQFTETGVFYRKFGTLGSGNGKMNFPSGIAIDSQNRVWVADTNNNRLEEFNEAGAFIRSVGSKGSGPGQMIEPYGLAITSEGNVWVADTGNKRLDEFTETGEFIRQVGSAGSGIGQFNVPTDVKVDSEGNLWVVDQNNARIQELNQQGEFIAQFGSPGSGPGYMQRPLSLALDNNGHVFVANYELNRVDEWTRQAMHSQISTEISVDGKRVDAAEAACSAATCSTEREWTLESSTLAPGLHTVSVKATDGLGNTTTKSVNIEISRDTNKPTLEVSGDLVSAPAGWIEQEEGNYGLHATATDSAYGVTSLIFSLDGQPIASKTQACAEGACSAEISTTVNARGLSAGAHQAEVVATDGAANTEARKWTINVDPEGSISTVEAEATFEALEATAPVNLIGESTEEEIEGTGPGLGVEEVDGELQGTGGAVPVSFSNESGGEIQMEVAGAQTFWPVCEEPGEAPESEEPEEAGESYERTEGATGESEFTECLPRVAAELRAAEEEEEVSRGEKTAGHEPITIRPVAVSDEESSVAEGVAAVTPNTNEAVDTVTRPLSDGGLNFEDIRSSSAPEHYGFEIEPYGSELELRQVSPTVITAFYKEGGYSAFTLEAEPARDADGHTVPTHLTLNSPLLVTLTVEHRGIAAETGKPFVYPVVAGTGWQGGWFYGVVEKYVPEEEDEDEKEGESVSEGGSSVTIMASGPPEVMPHSSDAWQIEPLSSIPFERRFKFTYCVPKHIPGNPAPPGSFEGLNRQISPETSECHREDFEGVRWATTVHGHYEYKAHHWVRVQAGRVDCGGWGEQYPEKKNCKVIGVGLTSGPADVIGEYRFPPGRGEWQWVAKPTCFVFGGKIYTREAPSGGGVPYERPPVWQPHALTYAPESCEWNDREREALG
jgi:sugar lactone lactonase YvrE